MEEEDKGIKTSVAELESFASGFIWAHMVAVMVEEVNRVMEENNSLDPFKNPTEIARNQGYVKAMSFIIDYPAQLKEQIEFNNTLEERKKNGKERD